MLQLNREDFSIPSCISGEFVVGKNVSSDLMGIVGQKLQGTLNFFLFTGMRGAETGLQQTRPTAIE